MVSMQSIDVVIGLVVVFLTVSLVCSSINELIVATLGVRANTLKNSLDSLLGSSALTDALIKHPAVTAAPEKDGSKNPSYIEPALFASALLGTVIGDPVPPANVPGLTPAQNTQATHSAQFAAAHNAITAPASGSLLAEAGEAKTALTSFLHSAQGSYERLHDQVASWFDAYMDRVSGDYKRDSQKWMILIAIVVVGSLNVDTVKVFKQLYSQPAVAAALADKAGTISKTMGASSTATPAPGAAPSDLGTQFNKVTTSISAIPVPIGWHVGVGQADNLAVTPLWLKIVGLAITAAAASLGAPFWFDALSKLANLRSAGAKPNGS